MTKSLLYQLLTQQIQYVKAGYTDRLTLGQNERSNKVMDREAVKQVLQAVVRFPATSTETKLKLKYKLVTGHLV